jgi:hypothetical protein
MRRVCTFVPAATLAVPAFGTTANAHPPTTAQRHTARPAAVAATPNRVIIWNPVRQAIMRSAGAQPATLKIADVDTIAHRFTLYHLGGKARRGASREAAAASAAHTVLVALYPQMQRGLDAQLAQSLAGVRSGLAKMAGVAVGVRAGRAILRLRSNGESAGALPPSLRGSTRQWRLAPALVAVESIDSSS